MGGWDPHNVTEDADVAVRLMRRGWRTAVIPSVTLEEAPLVLRSWWAQRIRWLKGWMQTWLVHMRRPWRLHREARLWPALSFHVVLAGQLASTFVFAPSLALFLARVFGLLPFLEDRAFVDDLLLVASLIGFTSGIAGSLVLAVRVAADDAGRRRRSPRVADLATMPIYWCLISVTAWWALLDLVVAPQRWNKTDHGLAERASSTPDPDDGLTPSAAAPRARASAGSCPSLAASCARPGGEAIDGDPRAGVVQG